LRADRLLKTRRDTRTVRFLGIYRCVGIRRIDGAPEIIFISPCECQGFHGKNRWIAKTDLTPVPLDKSAIQSVTPSQIYAWEGLAPDIDLASMVEARMPSEEKWYALTGRVVDAKVEADGDFDIPLEDATGNRRCHRRVGAKVLTNLCQE
jgi:hypothetical protein